MKLFKRILALFLVVTALIVSVSSGFSATAALSDSEKQEIKSEISKLNSEIETLEKKIKAEKSKLNDQNAIKSSLESKISAINNKIIACNRYIEACQSEIAENEAKISANNAKIEDTKELFKKRIRSIYNSNTDTGIQLLLGAESFSEFLTLTELTQCISAQDNKLVDEIVSKIAEINKDIEKNEQLKAEQAEIKKSLAADQAELDVQVNEVSSVINSINSTKNDLQSQQNALEKQMEAYEKELLSTNEAGENVPFDGFFRWPVPGYPMTTPYASNDSIHRGRHFGVDLGSYGINGKSILSAASGTVIRVVNSCPHNYRKSAWQFCGCGGGYGNHVQVAHGKHNGYYYMTIYAHMSKAVVSNGAKVNRGQVLGYVGSTGRSTGPHLHFGIAKGTVPGSYSWFNPMSISYSN